MLPQEAEIVVIGGGVVGSAVAYFLARAGKNVVLLEKGGMAGEASGANAAFVWSITRKPGIDIRLAMHSFNVHRQLKTKRNFLLSKPICRKEQKMDIRWK